MKYLTPKQFEKIEFRIARIKAVKRHPKRKKKFILLIDLGPVEPDVQIVADFSNYTMKSLIGKQVVYLVNMQPVMVGGIESQGMLMIAHKNGKPVLIGPLNKVLPGVKVYGVNDRTYVRVSDRTR